MVGRTLALFCVLLGGAVTAHAEIHVVETVHYRLHYEGTQADAQEAGRVLEAAWGGFEAFFGSTPELEKGSRLTVRFYATAGAWAAGIRRDGTRAPRGAGGYYWPPTRTAHLYRQPTVYFTRTLLIHEAAHQFHYLSRTRNANPKAGWYTEGVAEHLSWHRWDGERLELAVVPGVSLKDYPAKALAEIAAPAFDLGAIVDGGARASRPVSWALVRFLATGDGGKPLPRCDAFRAKMDRGGRAAPIFRKYFGRPGRLQPKLLAWLESHQTAWAPVFNEWEEIGPGAFRGYAGVVTACRLKQPAVELHARLRTPASSRWRGGVLLHWTSNEDYTVALLTAWGSVRVDRRRGGAWQRLYRGRWARASGGAGVQLDVQRTGDRVTLRVEGTSVGSWVLPGGILGLCLERADLRFTDVRWR